MTCVTEIVAMSAPPHLVRGVLTLTLDELAGALLLAALVVALVLLPGFARLNVATRAISATGTQVRSLADQRELSGQIVVGGALGQLGHLLSPLLG